jgi:phage terminase small subunit
VVPCRIMASTPTARDHVPGVRSHIPIRDQGEIIDNEPDRVPRKPLKISSRRNRFANEFARDLHGTNAAIRAGYAPKSARVTATKLLGDPLIQEKIQEAFDRRAERTNVDVDRVVREYARLAFANMGDFAEWGNGTNGDGNGSMTLVGSKELDVDAMAAVSEVIETTGPNGSTTKVKLHDKKGALDSLAKHLGMFVDKVELTGRVDIDTPAYREMSLEEARGMLKAMKAIEGEGSVE